jgi:exopolyphosphatase/guanosine-5'-triphosphate,3'-diphosphate pyrophosphatase
VTGGAPVRDETLVVDIGGGSSEFGAVSAGGLARAAGLRLGSNRLTTRFARTDPITATAFAAMSAAADEILRSALPAEPSDLVIVGGTASNLLKVTAAGVADRVLTRDRLREAAEHLLAEPAERLTTRFAVNPKRSPLLPAGAAIVEALMRHYDVDQVRVSDAGLREGAILAVGHAGRAWRVRLPALAHGWRS